ncbi:restriction endonuclease subunit S [Streptococcus suis]|nr:restriction endonuclease subunit S [Streptococcus suis]
MSDVSWQIKSLSELGRFSRGKSKHRPRNDKKLFTNGTYPLIQTGDIKNANLYVTKNSDYYNEFGLSQSKLWEQGTLCITIAANIAETAILSYPMCFPDSVVGFNAHKNESSELFVYYVFELIKKEIQKTSSGSIQDNINIDYLTKLKLKVPNKDYQDRIVNLLSTIDKKILINNQINEELEAMAKTLYDYWFVQFDFPDENGKPYKSSGGKMVYNDQLKREIPEGWGVKQLGEVCNIVMGQSPSGTSYNEIGEGIVFYQGSTDFGWRYPNVRQFTTAPTRYANENDILLSVRAPVGTLNIANETCCIGRGLAAINSKSGYNSFLFQQMQLYKKEFQLRDATGTTFGSIIKDDLFSLSMVIASENLMKRYENIVGKSYDKIKILSKQNKELTQLREWLLPMLMNGQVKVD